MRLDWKKENKENLRNNNILYFLVTSLDVLLQKVTFIKMYGLVLMVIW